MALEPETCEVCGFDGADYDLRDTLNTLRSLPAMWGQTVEGTGDGTLQARPSPDAWSVAEHTAHSAAVVEAVTRSLGELLTEDEPEIDLLTAARRPDAWSGFGDALEHLAANVDGLQTGASSMGGADDRAWRRTATVDGRVVDGAWVLRHAVHDATHHLMDVGRALHQLGTGPRTHTGSVSQISTSKGGVPKHAVPSAQVGRHGLVGDRQTTRQHHGRPFQALCLWSTEVLDALRAEGHPIAPGAAGENLTISGVDWSTIRPGVRLGIGEVLAEVSAWAAPCKKNAVWFVDGDFHRMGHVQHPGWSRAYAWVRRPGRVATGDAVVVEP